MTSHQQIQRMHMLAQQGQPVDPYQYRSQPSLSGMSGGRAPSIHSAMSGNSNQPYNANYTPSRVPFNTAQPQTIYANLPPRADSLLSGEGRMDSPDMNYNRAGSMVDPYSDTRPLSAMGGPPRSFMTGSVVRSGYNNSTIGRASRYSQSQYNSLGMKKSRSLNASRASLVSEKSMKTTIQQEYHDKKVKTKILSVSFGKARTPYFVALFLYGFSVLVFLTGLGLILARYVYQNIFLTHDREELIGPLLMAGSFGVFGLGCKFHHDAYKVATKERHRLRYQAANSSFVNVVTVSSRVVDPGEKIKSGMLTENAITRTPNGSRTTLSTVPGPQQKSLLG